MKKYYDFILRLISEIFVPAKMKTPVINYDMYWQLRNTVKLRNLPKRFSIIKDMIKDNSSILDIGCGDGSMLQYITKDKNIKEHMGYDISKEAAAAAQSRGVNAAVNDITSKTFFLEKKYDYIILSEVIEHIVQPEEIIEKIKNSFNNALILSLPNSGYFTYRLRLFFIGRFPVQWAIHPSEHLRYWTVKDFKDWAAFLGFSIKTIKQGDGIPFLGDIWPNLFASQIVVLLK